MYIYIRVIVIDMYIHEQPYIDDLYKILNRILFV